MKIRWITFLMIAAMLTSVAALGQSPVAQKEESSVRVAPIVPTVDGYDTGITVVNTGTSPLTITNFVFYSTSGSMAVGAEAAQVETANRKMASQSYTVVANGRFSMLVGAELLGYGLNGQLRFSIVGTGARKALAYEGILSPDFNTDIVEAKELTSRERSPQN
jgi:hypothetical protein